MGAVLVRLIYRSLVAVLSWLALSARSSASKNAEILSRSLPCDPGFGVHYLVKQGVVVGASE